MRRWGYAINSYYKTAHIHIEIAPWWVFFILWILDNICDFVHYGNRCIPIPNFKFKPKDNDGEFAYTRDWYVDFSGWFHSCIHDPIFYYLYDNFIENEMIDIDYNEVKSHMYLHDKDFWDEEMSICKGLKNYTQSV